MSNFRDKYEQFWSAECNLEVVGTRNGDSARANLLKGDTSEVFRLSGFFEGDFVYLSECGNKEIVICFNRYTGLELFEYMTIDDLLKTANDNDEIVISLYEEI